jgi:predicted DNA-binding transcriptional regulator
VSDESEEFALTHKTKRLLVVDLWEKFCPRYIVTMWDYSSGWTSWLYAVSVPPAPVKKLRQVEMTDEEYEKFISTNS